MEQLFYTKTHEWLKEEQDVVVIGITDHAQALLGDMVYVELPEVGSMVSAGDELGVVESVKAASDFYSPVSGTVLAVNQAAVEDPSIVNNQPYAQGWLVKLQPSNKEDIHHLLTTEQYQQVIAEE